METPGHTPGSLCFYSEKEGVLFSGDTLFFDGVGRTDLPGGSDKKLRESIEKKIAVLPPETRVFPGHGPFTTVERESAGQPVFSPTAAGAQAAGAAERAPSKTGKARREGGLVARRKGYPRVQAAARWRAVAQGKRTRQGEGAACPRDGKGRAHALKATARGAAAQEGSAAPRPRVARAT